MAGLDETQNTRPSLLLRLRDPDDRQSWQTFMDLYGPMILTYAQQRGMQEADAADVSQEVLAQVAKSIRDFTYDRERGRFRDWLGTVVRNRVHRHFRRVVDKAKAVDVNWLDELSAAQQDSEWADAFNSHILRAAMDRIRPHFEETTWESFRLTWLDQLPATTAAKQLGTDIATVYRSKSRVLIRLREEVTQLAEDLPLQPSR